MRARYARFVTLVFSLAAAAPQALAVEWPEHSVPLSKRSACVLADGEYALLESKPASRAKRRRAKLLTLYVTGADRAPLERKLRKLKKRFARTGDRALRIKIRSISGSLSRFSRCESIVTPEALCPYERNPSFPLLAGSSRALPLLQTGCAADLKLDPVEEPALGSLTLDGPSAQYEWNVDATGDTLAVRPCVPSAEAVGGFVCGAEIRVTITACSIQPLTHSVAAVESEITPFTLSAETSCGAPPNFELLSDAQEGTIALGHDGAGTYTAGWGGASDSFTYRLCDSAGAGCTGSVSAAVGVSPAPSFSGDPQSLAPYREAITLEERLHLARRLAYGRVDMLAGAGLTMPLSELVTQRILSRDYPADDLKPALDKLRDIGMTFQMPANEDAYVVVPDSSPPAPGAHTPLFLESEEFESTAAIRAGFERYLAVTARSFHPTLFKYYWDSGRMNSYLLLRARYLSPAEALLTKLWMMHFGVSTEHVTGHWEHLVGHYAKTVEREALGSFERMLLGTGAHGCRHEGLPGLVCDGAAAMFLNNSVNTKSSPNEDLAREILELWTTGREDEIAGHANYDDVEDPKSGAAFLSGYRLPFPNELYFDPARHNFAPQSAFLGFEGVYPGLPLQSVSLTPREFAAHILAHHPSVARYVGARLFRMLVHTEPGDELVFELGELLRSTNYDIGAFVTLLASSEAMFSAESHRRRCVNDPMRIFATTINGLRLPLISYKWPTDQLALQARNLTDRLNRYVASAGENAMGYPNVFAYQECGRDRGVSGAEEWLPGSKLLGRITGMVSMLSELEHQLGTGFGFGHLRDLITAAPLPGGAPPETADITPQHAIEFFAQLYGVELDQAQRAELLDYLAKNSAGQPVTWDPFGVMFEHKMAGLTVIMSSLAASNVH